ncbi:hypothetical protein CARN8_4250001 [mine drainage metagenome]|uniref:Uncharacterized protein n=1 Tax=mine drainage metagenome TaxID=410659 RepID=A0A3P3ZQD0_9ZZZZ
MKPFNLEGCLARKKVVNIYGVEYKFCEWVGDYIFGRINGLLTKHSVKGVSQWGDGTLFMAEDIKKIDWTRFQKDTLFDFSSGLQRYFAFARETGERYFFPDGRTSMSCCNMAVIVSDEATLSKNNPWIVWMGGECPIPDGVEFEYMTRDGDKAKFKYSWLPVETGGSIIAYRLTGNIMDGWEL